MNNTVQALCDESAMLFDAIYLAVTAGYTDGKRNAEWDLHMAVAFGLFMRVKRLVELAVDIENKPEGSA